MKIISPWTSGSVLWDSSAITKDDKVVIYTEHRLREKLDSTITNIAWILESPEILPDEYNWIEKNNEKFSHVFTHQKYLLDKGKNFLYAPGCSSWISHKGIHKKNKILSIIASSKNYTSGHRLRHDIILRHGDKMDIFGNAGHGVDSKLGYNPIEDKITGLQNYAFSITIENTKQDYYFSEKLIDCFVTGTVPIFWGCPSIGKFFNIDGIIIFNDINELSIIIETLSFDRYALMKNAIEENYELAKKYYQDIDYLYNNYPDIFKKK